MFNLFKKSCFSLLFALTSLSTIHASYMSCDYCNNCECNRIYIGAFGGELFSNSTKISQMGTAFFPEASGGPLAVFAQGRAGKKSSGFGGVQVGYEWAQFSFGCSQWSLTPAVEVEALFYSNRKRAHLINPTARLPEHDFFDTFHLNTVTCLVNAVFSLNNTCLYGFTPYIGGGIGAARISIRNANSLQVAPPEPGINHFNSRRNDSSWAFAAQAKVGLRYKICESLHIFGEYRYLFLDSSNYIFGSTVYPTHVPTSPWNVKINNMQYNAFAIGIQYDL